MKILNKKVKGFAISFEVILTLVMMFTIIHTSVYLMSMFNIQRYMDTVLSSTTMQMAKWGGNYSAAYRANVDLDYSYNTITQNTQRELDLLVPDLNAIISGTPNRITKDNTKVKCTLEWDYPESIFIPKIRKKAILEMESIIRPGALL